MKKTSFLLFTILILIVACGKKDTRQKFTTAKEYYNYVIASVEESQKAYQQTSDFPKGKEYCLAWCDSTLQIAGRNEDRLNQIQPFKGDSSLTVAGRDFLVYLQQTANGKDLKEYIDWMFSTHDKNSENQWEYEQIINDLERKLGDGYQSKMDAFENEKQKFSIKQKL